MNRGTKINHLLQDLPANSVLLSSWLRAQGYSYELQQQYRKSGWLVSIGKGAMLRNGQDFILAGAIFALQKQAKKNIHIGGRTALELHGYSHYLEIDSKETVLYAPQGTKLPSWILNNKWNTKPVLVRTSFLPYNMGLTDFNVNGLNIKISDPARAIMECLVLAPKKFDLDEAYEIMEGLMSLRPSNVQKLLEQCKSIKVKRLFLYLAEKAKHSWFNYLDQEKINIGMGKRSLVKDGIFIPKYKITIPQSLL